MKKQIIYSLVTIILVELSSSMYAQNQQNYQGTTAFNTLMGYISGTEKYTYIVEGHGKKTKNGAYSFSGEKTLSNNTAELSGVYTLTANYKKGNLNGSYVSATSVKGKNWSWSTGWVPVTASVKLTGVFLEGKPNGTFTATYSGDETYKGTATMKNGKFVGVYEYVGDGANNHLWKIKGQFSSDGKLTGQWQIEDIIQDVKENYTFMNNVAIGGGTMSPSEQNIAKQYAEGKISKEKVMEKGYIVSEHEIPIHYFIDFLLLRKEDDFGLNKIGGYDFSDYGPITYTLIKEGNLLTNEGFEKICNAIVSSGNANAKYKETYCKNDDCTTYCESFIREGNGMYCLRCGKKFSELYGSFHEIATDPFEVDHLFLTTAQYEKLSSLQDSVAMEHAYDFRYLVADANPDDIRYSYHSPESLYSTSLGNLSTSLGNLYYYFRNDTEKYNASLPVSEEELSNLYNKCQERYNYLLDYFYSQNSNSRNKSIQLKFSPDSQIVVIKHKIDFRMFGDSGDGTIAWHLEMLTMEKFMQTLKDACALAKNIKEKNGKIKNRIAKYQNVLSKNLSTYYTEHCRKKTNSLAVEAKALANFEILLDKVDSINSKNEVLQEKLSKDAYDKYYEQYSTILLVENVGSNVSFDAFKRNINNLIVVQEFFNKCAELQSAIDKQNNMINENFDNSYSEIVTLYNVVYKNNGSDIYLITDKPSGEKEVKRLEGLKRQQESVVKYMELLNEIKEQNEKILNKCEKKFSDIIKPYKTRYKAEVRIPDLSSVQTSIESCNLLSNYYDYQQQLLQYINKREKIDELNNSIQAKCSSAKNCKKAYNILYKSLPITWQDNFDNFSEIDKIIYILKKVDEQYSTNISDLDVQFKKVKTPDEVIEIMSL